MHLVNQQGSIKARLVDDQYTTILGGRCPDPSGNALNQSPASGCHVIRQAPDPLPDSGTRIVSGGARISLTSSMRATRLTPSREKPMPIQTFSSVATGKPAEFFRQRVCRAVCSSSKGKPSAYRNRLLSILTVEYLVNSFDQIRLLAGFDVVLCTLSHRPDLVGFLVLVVIMMIGISEVSGLRLMSRVA